MCIYCIADSYELLLDCLVMYVYCVRKLLIAETLVLLNTQKRKKRGEREKGEEREST